MAVHFWFGRVLSVFLLVLFGLAGTARANHFLTHPAATPQGAAAREARTLFERGAEIKVKRDAKVYITPQNIPKNDRLLKVYSADKATEGTSAPSLLSIAIQAYRSQAGAGGPYVVQLAALKSQDGARPAWGRLQKAHTAAIDKVVGDMKGDMSKKMPKDQMALVHALLDDAKMILAGAKHNHAKPQGIYDHARAIGKADAARGFAVAADMLHFKMMKM